MNLLVRLRSLLLVAVALLAGPALALTQQQAARWLPATPNRASPR